MSSKETNPDQYLKIIRMAHWQSRILQAVAWIVGIRGEDVWVVTMSGDDELYQEARKARIK